MSFETLPASTAAWNIIKQIKAAADTFEWTKGFLIKLMSEVMTLHDILQLSDQEASLSQQGRGMFGHTISHCSPGGLSITCLVLLHFVSLKTVKRYSRKLLSNKQQQHGIHEGIKGL